jgi:hypothetical protein
VLALTVIVLAVIALAVFGRVLDSTAALVRALRMPSAPATLAEAGADGGPRPDAPEFALDASFEATPLAPPPLDDLRAPVAPRLNGADARADFSPPTALDIPPIQANETQGGTTGTVVASTSTVDASAPAVSKDAASEPPPRPAKEAAAPIRCGQRTCPEGQECCNWACSICVSPGETCSLSCGSPSLPVSAACGPNTCNVSEVCCNASCGICVPAGGTCSKKPCEGMYLPVSPTCGMNTCNSGEVCCNPSCGICVKPGETCSQEPCR